MSAWTPLGQHELVCDYGNGFHGHAWRSTVRKDGRKEPLPRVVPVWWWALCGIDGSVLSHGKHFDPVDAELSCDDAHARRLTRRD